MARRSPAYARSPVYPEQDPIRLPITEQDPQEALSEAINPVDLPQPDVPHLGTYGETEGKLTGGEGLEAEKLDWTPVTDEQAQRWMEETQIDNARKEARMLSDDMVNSRRDLVDKLYGGRDPSLENTKPIIDELKKTQWQTLKAGLGDPDEMTPEEKLRAATLKINSDRDAALRVEDQKQANVDRLNKAVSQTNEALGAEITSIQNMAKQLTEKHIAQDEAIQNQSRRSVAMQRLFNMRKALEKLEDEPPPEMIEIYNNLAGQLGEQMIDVENKEEAEGTWWKPWTWGGKTKQPSKKVRRWNPQTGRLES